MKNDVPLVAVALALWFLCVALSAAIVRRALFAFVLGVLFTACFMGYCMYYQGPVEMGGIIHALCGGAYGVLTFHFISWLRSRLHHPAPSPEAPNPTLQRMPGSASVSKPDVAGPAPLS